MDCRRRQALLFLWGNSCQACSYEPCPSNFIRGFFILFRGPSVRCSLSLLSLHFASPGTALPSTSLDEFLETL